MLRSKKRKRLKGRKGPKLRWIRHRDLTNFHLLTILDTCRTKAMIVVNNNVLQSLLQITQRQSRSTRALKEKTMNAPNPQLNQNSTSLVLILLRCLRNMMEEVKEIWTSLQLRENSKYWCKRLKVRTTRVSTSSTWRVKTRQTLNHLGGKVSPLVTRKKCKIRSKRMFITRPLISLLPTKTRTRPILILTTNKHSHAFRAKL